MKKEIWIAILILFLPYTAYAGMGACHNGSGVITLLEIDANSLAFGGFNCEYYSIPPTSETQYNRIYSLLSTVQKKYIKWVVEPVEMTQAEKNVVDAAEQIVIRDDNRVNYKAQYDVVYLRSLVEILISEINILRQRINSLESAIKGASTFAASKTALGTLPSMTDRTLLQLRNSLETKVDELTP
jgi:hypothetical protein